MLDLVHSSYLEIKRSGFLIFVVILAFLGALLSVWVNIWFFCDHATNSFPKSILLVLGGALGVGKFLFGLIAVFSQAPSERKLRKFAVTIFSLLLIISFVVGFKIYDQAFVARRAVVDSSIKKMQSINKSIEDRRSVVEGLILQQKIDLENNYSTRAYSLYPKIKEEHAKIDKLIKSMGEIKGSDLTFFPILGVLDFMISLGIDLWQKIIAVIFGSLFEIANVFLLYLIWETSTQSIPFRNNVISIATFYRDKEEVVH